MKHFDRFSDNGRFQSSNTRFGGSFVNQKFNCVGNESVINDCPKNEQVCQASMQTFHRTQLSCESKMYFSKTFLINK